MEPIVKSGQEWTFDKIEDIYDHIERIAKEKYNLDIYPNQLEMISYEQMLDAYTSVGMPIFYSHWSFGESFVRQMEAYKRGHMGLAYEIIINSNPCIAYLMEENTMLMQTLVIAHASFGHNFFFKNNYLFRQWTDADAIIDYLAFAKKYIRDCEEKFGVDEVEQILDAAHSLQSHGIDKYKRPTRPSAQELEIARRAKDEYIQQQYDEIWKTIPKTRETDGPSLAETDAFPSEPQENILYFIEKHAPRLEGWKREIIRIVRRIAQYFYPQRQTKVMNEGCATYFHYRILHDLYEEGIVDSGAMLEFYENHTNVVFQPDYHSKYFSGINPYALGFAMFKDIERVATNPTEEDINWFRGQKWVGSGDWLGTIKYAIKNFKDESFIQQYLSPKVIRDFKMFALHDDERDEMYEIAAIHNDQGYRRVRESLSNQYNIGYQIPDIQVTSVDKWGDRSMTLTHFMNDLRPLEHKMAIETLNYISYLWDYDVHLISVDSDGITRAEYSTGKNTIDIFEDNN